MAESNPSAFTEFLKACLFLLFFPWMPLIFEFLRTISSNSAADRFLERTSVVVTASLLAAGVGIASKYRPVFGFCLVMAVLLAVMYGAVPGGSHGGEGNATDKHTEVNQKNFDQAHRTDHSTGAQIPVTTLSAKLDMDDVPGKISWGVMLVTSAILIVERMIRHLFYREPYKFEWSK